MAYAETYVVDAPERAALDALPGPLLIEFGTEWCGHCAAARPLIAAVMSGYPALQHLKYEDGPGRPLGRSFRVKLWPTLILMRDGREIARVVRPADDKPIRDLLLAGGLNAA